MPERAHVTSVDAIKSFKTSLIVYLSKARPDPRGNQRRHSPPPPLVAGRPASPLAGRNPPPRPQTGGRPAGHVQRPHLQSERRHFRRGSGAHAAKRALDEAETKLRTVKRWTRDFDSRVEPMAKQLEKLQTMLLRGNAPRSRLLDPRHQFAGRLCQRQSARRR